MTLLTPEETESFSFSTSWNIKKHTNGREMIEEILALGFKQVELNYQVDTHHLQTIEPMIEQGRMSVSSVHHVFPKAANPAFGPDSLMLGSTDEGDRQYAIELLIQTAEYAHCYGAKAVVLHPGEAEIPVQFDAELKRMYREGRRDSEAYRLLFDTMLEQRTRSGAEALKRIEHSLETVVERLAKRNLTIPIGLETRARCHQIPTPSEAASVIQALQGSELYLWVDVGHALMMERMGLYNNTLDLPAYQHLIYGMHIHDTVGLSDHWCPYVHSEDIESFERFLPAIAAAPLKVFELKPNCSPEDIKISVQTLRTRLSAR